MPSKFGGIEIAPATPSGGSRFGGVPIDQAPAAPQAPAPNGFWGDFAHELWQQGGQDLLQSLQEHPIGTIAHLLGSAAGISTGTTPVPGHNMQIEVGGPTQAAGVADVTERGPAAIAAATTLSALPIALGLGGKALGPSRFATASGEALRAGFNEIPKAIEKTPIAGPMIKAFRESMAASKTPSTTIPWSQIIARAAEKEPAPLPASVTQELTRPSEPAPVAPTVPQVAPPPPTATVPPEPPPQAIGEATPGQRMASGKMPPITDYPKAANVVSGLKVGKDIPNLSSIDSSLNNPEELPGIREVPINHFENPGGGYASATENARVSKLADQIKQSGEIKPLIVVVDKQGPYVLEGGHRLGALNKLGVDSIPAKVVIDRDEIPASPAEAPLQSPTAQGRAMAGARATRSASADSLSQAFNDAGVTSDSLRKLRVWDWPKAANQVGVDFPVTHSARLKLIRDTLARLEQREARP